MTLLEVRGLEVYFELPDGELHAVQGVDLSLDRGERLGLVGESGSGKTTTVLALMGLLPPTASLAGTASLDGRDLLSSGEHGTDDWRWAEVSTVFQGAMNALNPVRTIGWQIAEPMRVHHTASGAAARARTRELIGMVGLPASVEASYPHELSGGMRQRAAIAMALACQPKVLLADEPTTALDVVVQASILELLDRLAVELDLALVLVTHDLGAAVSTCTRMAVMYAGRVVEEGSIDDLRKAPEHPYTRQLFAAIPDLYESKVVTAIPGAPPRLDQPITGCPFAPRCNVRMDRCEHERPILQLTSPGRSSACHLSESGGAGKASVRGLRRRAGHAVEIPRPAAAGDAVLAIDSVAVSFARRRPLGDAIRAHPRPVVRALDGVSLEMRAGEMVAIVGESGSGKTTMAQAIIGNVELADGEIAIVGQRRSTMKRRDRATARRHAQLVYQDPYESLDPRMRVRSILDEPLRVNRIATRRRDRDVLAAAALTTVGLDPPELFLDRYPHELSGGQRQRVAIAAALVMEPAIIIADEPVSMLDVSIRAEVLEVLDALRREHSVAVGMITHDLSTAAHYADQIAVMYLGRIVEQGPAREVISNPHHPYTRALIAAVPTLNNNADLTQRLAGEIPDATAVPSGCRFHPRCPVALAQCSAVDPSLVDVGPDHVSACVLTT
jgi:peptide/nickel transport system ATP-binding protein